MTYFIKAAFNKLVWWRDQPPNLDDIFKDLHKKFKSKRRQDDDGVYRISPGKKNSGGSGVPSFNFIALLLLFLWAVSGVVIVQAPESAVVLRLGKYNRTLAPGPHWIPRIFETYHKENVQRIQEFSYGSEMLTRDENIVYVSLSIQYRINDLQSYLFNVVNPVASLQQATASALRQVAGHTTLDEILTTGRGQARDQIETQIKHILSIYKPGIEVSDVNLQPAKPPEQVTAAFDDAIKAREDEQRFMNLATADANRKVERANGQAMRIDQDSKGYYARIIKEAEAETARFVALVEPYAKFPEIVRARIYFQALQSIYQRVQKVLIDSGGKQDGKIIYLPIEQMLKNSSNLAASRHAANQPGNYAQDISYQDQKLPDAAQNYTNNPREVVRQGY